MKKASNWLDDGVAADLDLHRRVAAASANPYIATVVGFLVGQIRQSIMFMGHYQNRFVGRLAAMNIAERSAIHKALMKRGARSSALAMRAQITAAAKRLGCDLSPAVIEVNLLG